MEYLFSDSKKIKDLDTFMELFLNAQNKEKKEIYLKYENVIKKITPFDIFQLSMYQDNTVVSEKIIKDSANLFVNIFNHHLEHYSLKDHHHIFFKSIIEENNAIVKHLNSIKELLKKKELSDVIINLQKAFEKCLEFEKKFVKKENIIFPQLESRLNTIKPLKIMWKLHDDARALLKEILTTINSGISDRLYFNKIIGEYYFLIFGIIKKETHILYPVASAIINDDILDDMFVESLDYGYALIEVNPTISKNTNLNEFINGEFVVANGSLNFSQLNLLLNNLPIDITYVDEFDRVRYFNNTKNRHFPRNPSVINRLVEYCHPPKSVNVVKKIIQSFKDGSRDFADFWINYKGSTIYIQYYAIRDNSNLYKGVLEVSQDISNIKNISGEKRILDWE